MLGTNFTYKYVAQSAEPGAYGSDVYGGCAYSDTVCQTSSPTAPGAPNTGFFSPSNAPVYIGGFVAVALIVTIATYAILRKLKKQKS